MNKNINVCNNCGKTGHQFNQCKLPIISYGIVLFRYDENNQLQFLMIRRKDSFGFIDFIRGKYLLHNINQIQDIINEMSVFEKDKLNNSSFDKLWKDMWCEISNSQFKSEEIASFKKYELLKNGIIVNNEKICLKDIIDKSTTNWTETEWEFPKGRRNYKEKDLDCALREFEEETGIFRTEISVVENILPFEEIFIGTNYKSYKHKYFLANINKDLSELNLDNFQKTEVSKLEWKSFNECLVSIRPYNLEKKKLITNINKVLEEYSLYS
jgi:8-oxo-dGTP pyrophosphatase MutT (NUDIX family)